MKGEDPLLDEIRYFSFITIRRDLTATEVVYCVTERCDQENIIEQLKNGGNAMGMPLYDLVSNWAYMVIAALAASSYESSANQPTLKRLFSAWSVIERTSFG